MPTRHQRHPSARRKAQGSECCMSASFVAAHWNAFVISRQTRVTSHVKSAAHRLWHLEKSLIDPDRPPNAVVLGKSARTAWRCGGCGLVSLVPRLPRGRPNRGPSVNRGGKDGLSCGRRAEFSDRRRRERVYNISRMCANGKTAIQNIRPNRLCQDARTSCSQAVRSFCLRPHVSKICRYRFN